MSRDIIVPGEAVVCDENQMAQLNKPITKLELATLLGELRRDFFVSNIMNTYVNSVVVLVSDILSWIQRVANCPHGLCEDFGTSVWRLGVPLWLKLRLSRCSDVDEGDAGLRLSASVFLRHPMFGIQNVYVSPQIESMIDIGTLYKSDVMVRSLLNVLLDVRLIDQFSLCENIDDVPNDVKLAFPVQVAMSSSDVQNSSTISDCEE
ncbi:MAG: hypothetical protein QXY15_10495 [Candidatus Nitrosotenuis sp.]